MRAVAVAGYGARARRRSAHHGDVTEFWQSAVRIRRTSRRRCVLRRRIISSTSHLHALALSCRRQRNSLEGCNGTAGERASSGLIVHDCSKRRVCWARDIQPERNGTLLQSFTQRGARGALARNDSSGTPISTRKRETASVIYPSSSLWMTISHSPSLGTRAWRSPCLHTTDFQNQL